MAWKRKENFELSDSELIGGCLSDDKKSQELLYKRYFSYAMSICIRYTKSSTEAIEVVNDGFMKVLENLETYDSAKPFKTWYAKILVNTSIDSYRRSAKHDATLSISYLDEMEDQEPTIESDLSVEDILKLYDELPEAHKITFNLYEIEGYSHKEIGEMLGVTESTSRSTLTRAKKMLQILYSKHINPKEKRHEAI
ncbi:MAG: RNA polymerase sigma factor [Bacteroidales bacterium]|nr:RNA polymerase sigma factor [Bacteroidales bacterium]